MKDATPHITKFHEAVADAHGISLYDHYAERDAANVLGLSLVALRRLRASQQISALRLSPRRIAFFGYQLVEYLMSAVESVACPDTTKIDNSNSENFGSRSKPEVTLGAAHGLTQKPDKQSVYRSALRTLNTQSKS